MSPTFSRVRILAALACIGLAVFLTLRVRDRGKVSEEQTIAAIERVLKDQEDSWNRGNLDGFMAGYWRSEELTFFSGGTVRHGWQETFDRYRWRYTGDHRELALTHLFGQTLAAQTVLQPVVAAGLMYSDAFTAEMGTLTFEDVRIVLTGPKSAVVRGHWGLKFRRRAPVGGLFTLLFREEAQGWCIVHDHTSG